MRGAEYTCVCARRQSRPDLIFIVFVDYYCKGKYAMQRLAQCKWWLCLVAAVCSFCCIKFHLKFILIAL